MCYSVFATQRPSYEAPYYLWNGESYGLQTWQAHSRSPYEQKSVKNFSDKRVWAYRGTAQIIRVGLPHIISRTDKATNFKFCVHIYRLDRNKSSLKILGKVAVGVVRDSFRAPIHWVNRAVIFAIAWLSCMFLFLREAYSQQQAK